VVATNLSNGVSRVSGRPLTNSKHEHFAHMVTKGESPARAYILCGYSEHGALQRLKGKTETVLGTASMTSVDPPEHHPFVIE
jgi:hypothetical protein